MEMQMEVKHVERKRKFYIEIGGYTAKLKYKKKKEDVLEIHSTEVPESLRGKGVGNALVKAAMEYAREFNYKVKPACAFVEQFFKRNHQYDYLLAS
jgi:uncharacterized protein